MFLFIFLVVFPWEPFRKRISNWLHHSSINSSWFLPKRSSSNFSRSSFKFFLDISTRIFQDFLNFTQAVTWLDSWLHSRVPAVFSRGFGISPGSSTRFPPRVPFENSSGIHSGSCSEVFSAVFILFIFFES